MTVGKNGAETSQKKLPRTRKSLLRAMFGCILLAALATVISLHHMIHTTAETGGFIGASQPDSLRKGTSPAASVEVAATSRIPPLPRPSPKHSRSNNNNNNTTTPSIETHQATAPYAYVFLLAGCDPNKPTYRGFLFNILLATHQLRQHSQADVVVLVRMAVGHHSPTPLLPRPEQEWLAAVGAHVVYLPPPQQQQETFSSVQLLKFHILRLVQYERVLFLDSDVLPLCNLDYLFDLTSSQQQDGVLRENLVLAWTKEPANGGFFMLQPSLVGWEQLQDCLRRQRQEAQRILPVPHFDKIKGWGTVIPPQDPWFSFQRKLSGHKWSFYAAYSDQGLLYHYVKFIRRSVSIVLGKTVQNFVPGPNGTVVLQNELDGPFGNYTCRSVPKKGGEQYLHHPATDNYLASLPPYGDFAHFYSVFKPWEHDAVIVKSKSQAKNVMQYWYYLLRQLNERLDMGLPLDSVAAWREYASIFRAPSSLGENRVPNLKQLARQNKSIHDVG